MRFLVTMTCILFFTSYAVPQARFPGNGGDLILELAVNGVPVSDSPPAEAVLIGGSVLETHQIGRAHV